MDDGGSKNRRLTPRFQTNILSWVSFGGCVRRLVALLRPWLVQLGQDRAGFYSYDWLEPTQVIGLENWGTFVLQPIDSATTRLIVQTRGDASPGVASFLFASLDVFAFEPAHFIMERGMLPGIRRRAEGVSAIGHAD
jgi:hypothetical protein